MATIWKSANKTNNNNSFTGTTLSSWSRQQKFAMIAGFAILGLLLALSACSKQTAKSALVGVSGPAATAAATQAPTPSLTPVAPTTTAPPVTAKKAAKKRPANVTYTDPNSGVSFAYPRKFALASGEKAQPKFADEEVPMNFVQPGGATVATVAVPSALYPGTDFASGFFSVNVNRSLSEQECSHFAFVDTRDADGEPIDAEKVKVGSTDMEMTAEFSGSATKQAEAQYYHNYDNGACYEFVLGLGTAGYGTTEGIEPVNRDEVFARLEKILGTVKVKPAVQQPAAEPTVASADPAN